MIRELGMVFAALWIGGGKGFKGFKGLKKIELFI